MRQTVFAALIVTAGLAATTLCGCARPASAGPRGETDVALDIRKRLDPNAVEVGAPAATGESPI